MSDLSTTSHANHTSNNGAGKKPGDNEIRITIGVDVSRKESSGSELETSSVEELDRSRLSMPKTKQWRGGVGPRGDPALKRVESQTNLIEGRRI